MSPPLKLAIKLLYTQSISYMVVFQLKTGYIVVYPPETWLCSSFPQYKYEMVVLSRKTGYIVVFPH